MTKKEREIIHHLETRPEACVTYTSDEKELGYPIFHYFPIEFITDRPADQTKMYSSILKKTGNKRLARFIVEWAQKAKIGNHWESASLNVTIEGGE